MKSCNINFLEPSGPLQACNWTDLHFLQNVPLSWNLGILTSWNHLDHSRPVMGLIYIFITKCAIVMKSGNINFAEPSGPLQTSNGTELPLLQNIQPNTII